MLVNGVEKSVGKNNYLKQFDPCEKACILTSNARLELWITGLSANASCDGGIGPSFTFAIQEITVMPYRNDT